MKDRSYSCETDFSAHPPLHPQLMMMSRMWDG